MLRAAHFHVVLCTCLYVFIPQSFYIPALLGFPGSTLKATKITDGNFDINLTPGENTAIRLQLKEGELYLSISGVLLSGKGLWYELPLKDIITVEIAEEEPFQIKFIMENIEVVLKGNNPLHLKALRHFLLPFVSNNS